MSAAITLPWQPSRVAALCQSVGLPGLDGAYPNIQFYPQWDMAQCIFWTTLKANSLFEALECGLLHRTDGPAVTWLLRDNTVANEQWWLCGQLHRLDGPAFVTYAAKGRGLRQWIEKGRVLREERV